MTRRQGRGGPPSERSPPSTIASRPSGSTSLPATAPTTGVGDGFLFSGNRHETVPRRVLLDGRLTPLERNAWQIFRMLLQHDGITAFPTYETLRPYLASMPCGPKASSETIARALTLLRLTRWLTLAQRRRDPVTGRIQGNLYILHDESLTPYETIQLDPHYLDLISQSLGHASAAIRRVAMHVLREVSEDPAIAGRILPHRLDLVAERMREQGWQPSHDALDDEPAGVERSLGADPTRTPAPSPSTAATHDSEERPHHSEDGALAPSSESCAPPSDSEASGQPAPLDSLRNPKSDSTVRTSLSIEPTYDTASVSRARAREDDAVELRLPDRFGRLTDEQQQGALAMLRQLPVAVRQPVLDEWAARLRSGDTVRRPAGYLYGLIQRAMRGEFHSWAAHAPMPSIPSAPVRPASPATAIAATRRKTAQPASDVAKESIAQLRKLFHMT